MKKRMLALFLVVMMVFSAIPVSAAPGATEPTFVVKTVEAAAGETVDVTIEVANNPGIASIKLLATYDANLTLNSITYNNAIGGMFMQPQKLTSPVILNWFNGAANSNGDWVFATLSFTVADTAAAGTYPITITYEADNVYNINFDNLDFAITNGGVTVVCQHTSKTEVPAKSADCLTPGNNQYYICDACDAAFKADGTETTVEAETIVALGHDYKAVVTDPACTEKGYTTHTCSRCGDSYVDSYVAALDHDYVATVIAPTCTEQGYTTHTCSRCNDSYKDTYVDALGHSFGDWVVTTAPTCTTEGVETRTCTACGEKETRSVDALEHDYVATVTAPTCTEKGYTTHTRSRCNDSYKDTYVDELGHSYETTVWSKGEDGHWHACSVCGDKKDFTAHDFGDAGDKCLICDYERDHVHRPTLVPAVEATCTTAGSKAYYTCSGCEDWFEDFTCNVKIADHSSVVVAALGHDYKGVVTAPTCLAGGYTTYTCSRCGDSYVGDYVDALGHNYVAVVTAPTCTEQGYTTHTCSRCDNSYVDTYVDALGHDYVATVTAPTCTEQGYTTHACSRCDASYVDTYVDALGHDFAEAWSKGDATGHWHTCTRCDAHDTPVAHTPGPEATEFDPQICTVCGYVIQPELGHSITKVEGYPATCTEAGQKTYYVCEGCGLWFEDATGNVEITDHDSVILLPSHDWQEATCTAPKTCKVCGETEGEANGHTASEWVSDETSHWKVCTVCEEVIDGSKADHADENKDGKCDACGYAMMQNYEVIEGADAKWTVTSGETLTFRADGEFSLFTGVMMDGVLVDPSNYTAVSGSTIVTFKAEYLKTLRAGEHTMTVMFTNGSASANFEIKAGSGSNGAPNTGDNSHFLLWTALLLVSAAGMATLVIAGKKKPYDGKYVK